jgi:hypothetical protein
MLGRRNDSPNDGCGTKREIRGVNLGNFIADRLANDREKPESEELREAANTLGNDGEIHSSLKTDNFGFTLGVEVLFAAIGYPRTDFDKTWLWFVFERAG